jgi:hypothetical protein
VEAADAQSGLRSWEETLHRIAAGWPRCKISLPLEDWEWDGKTGIWVAR